jgi:hypothetical protein
VDRSDPYTEGSETAPKVPEGLQWRMPLAQNPVLTNRNGIRGYRARISKHIIAKSQISKTLYSRYRKNRRKEDALTGGYLGLDSVFLYTKKSAEVIVVAATSRHRKDKSGSLTKQ